MTVFGWKIHYRKAEYERRTQTAFRWRALLFRLLMADGALYVAATVHNVHFLINWLWNLPNSAKAN